jgi:hypothetical protein
MEWSPLPEGIKVPKWKLRRSTNRGGGKMEITTVGLDLVKNVIQLHAVNQHGKANPRKSTRTKVPASSRLEYSE